MGNNLRAGGVVVVREYFLAYILIPPKIFPRQLYKVMNQEDKELILSSCYELVF